MAFRRWTIVVGACLLLLLTLAGYKFLQIRQMIAFAESFPEPSATVERFTVTSQNWQDSTHTVGEVLAPQSLVLRNEVDGRVIAIGFTAGDTVKKDQMLVQLDASEEIAQLRAAQADADLARLALSRYEKLIAHNLSSREQYDQANAQQAIALARAQALQAVIDKKTLTAPFDGQAGLHTLQVGQYLSADTALTQLIGNRQTLWVDFSLPQQQALIEQTLTLTIMARGILSTPVTGHIIASEPSLSTQSRNIKMRASVDNSTLALKPGMLVDVQINTALARTVYAVPATAVQYDKDGTYVFVLQHDDKNQLRAHQRRVTAGAEKNGMIVIANGLQSDEHIATNGAYKLQEDMLTYLKPATTTGSDTLPP